MADPTIKQLPDAVFDSDIAILGRKGGGKTYTAKGLVERLLDMGRRVLVLDPLGVWAGLRTAADGKSPGFRIAIFGGRQGDLPLEPAAAEAMADVLATQNVPAVMDLSDLSKMAQQSFLLAFLQKLRRVNTEALTIVLEEADVFAPQNPMGDDSKRLHGEIDWIARRGRSFGFRLITITQRPARLSKDVLTQCATMIAHKLPSPQDRDAVRAWVDGNGDRDKAREVFDTLSKLAVGEAWVWAPEQDILQRMRFPAIRSLDTSSTPKAGERRVTAKTLADVDLSAVRAALAAQAAAGGGKPKKERPAPAAPADAAALAAAEQRGYLRGRNEFHERLATANRELAAAAQRAFDEMMRTIADAFQKTREAAAARPAPPASSAPAKTTAPTPTRAGAEAAGPLSPTTQKIYAVLVAAHPLSLTFKAAALRAGASPRSSQFREYRKQLVESGLVEEVGERLRSLVGDPAAAQPADPVELFASRLAPSTASMLRVIAAASGASIDRNQIADAAGVSRTSSGLGAGLRELVDLELVQRAGSAYRLSPELCEDA